MMMLETDSLLLEAAVRHSGKPQACLPRLVASRFDRPTEVEPLVYDPIATLVLQGRKRVFIGDRVFVYGPGRCMIVAAEIAAMGQISEASPETPFVAVGLYLDPIVLADLIADLADMPDPPVEPGFGFSEASPMLLDAWRRLLELLDRPGEIPVMGQLLERELTFRLLMGPHGALLRQIAGANSRLSQIRLAMAWIRERYSEPLGIDAMAEVAGMSRSAFHRRFKAVTALSPLQYQKQIRLHAARRKMIVGRADAASAAFAVGYESASQFSRDYKRLFGMPPARDVGRLRGFSESAS